MHAPTPSLNGSYLLSFDYFTFLSVAGLPEGSGRFGNIA
jgi:hypothetical protein